MADFRISLGTRPIRNPKETFKLDGTPLLMGHITKDLLRSEVPVCLAKHEKLLYLYVDSIYRIKLSTHLKILRGRLKNRINFSR